MANVNDRGKVVNVEIRKVYGREQVYPVGFNAERFAEIAGTKTLTTEALRLIRALGYEIHEVYQLKLADIFSQQSRP